MTTSRASNDNDGNSPEIRALAFRSVAIAEAVKAFIADQGIGTGTPAGILESTILQIASIVASLVYGGAERRAEATLKVQLFHDVGAASFRSAGIASPLPEHRPENVQ